MVNDRFMDADVMSCPYPYLDEVRRDSRAFYAPSMGGYVVTNSADVQQVMTNPKLFSSTPAGDINFMANFAPRYDYIYEAAGVPPLMPALVVTDGDVHKRYRGHVERFFTVSAVRKMEHQVSDIIDQLIDGFIEEGQADLYRQFCLKLPLYIICDMLGLPRTDIEYLQEVADAVVRLSGGFGESEDSRVALHGTEARFHQYLAVHINRVRARPDDTLLSALLHTLPPDGRPMSDAEVMSLIMTLNVGGNETTTNGLGNMFWLAFQAPDVLASLRADRAAIPKFVEESLRLESPVTTAPRWVVEDTTIGDVPVPAGSVIIVSITGANRDQAQFGCPADIKLDRKGMRNHFAFGLGVHYCLGSSLARMEMAAAMNRVLDRMEDIEIDASKFHGHQPKFVTRAVSGLPIRFRKIEVAPLP